MNTTNLTELAEYFPSSTSKPQPMRVGGIKSLHFKDYHAQWIPDARAWEVFLEAECECCVGNADTLKEALEVARWHDENS